MAISGYQITGCKIARIDEIWKFIVGATLVVALLQVAGYGYLLFTRATTRVAPTDIPHSTLNKSKIEHLHRSPSDRNPKFLKAAGQ
jgi:hypothetical protein